MSNNPIMQMKRWLLLIAAPWLIGATNDVGPASTQDDARATARVVKSVLEYTRWPQHQDVIDLCVIGPSRFGEGFGYATLDNGVPIRRRNFNQPDSGAASTCDALYLGRIDAGRARQWTALVRGAPVVTIAELDPQCASEAMICLIYRKTALSFQLNMDAVARSKVRIDPRIFRMSKGF